MANQLHTLAELRRLLVECNGNMSAVAIAIGIPRNTLESRMGSLLRDMIMTGDGIDADVVEMSVRLAKQKQAAQDTSRVERKSFREYARVENAVSAYAREIAALLKAVQFSKPPEILNDDPSGKGLIVHWSDQHLNERVELPHNTYDWHVAGRRLRKHVQAALRVCEGQGIGHVLVAMTGDLLNSDRRLDELQSNAGNRAKASVLAVDLYQQALRELRQHVSVTVSCISGNESRIPKDVGWAGEVASDNYDFAIFEMLRKLLAEQKIDFVSSDDPGEVVVNVAGQNCLSCMGMAHSAAKLRQRCSQLKAVMWHAGSWLIWCFGGTYMMR